MPNIAPFIPSFGRRKGHKLHVTRAALMQTLLPKLLIALPLPPAEGRGEGPHPTSPASGRGIELSSLFTQTGNQLWFEIGFGGGEHLAEQALRNRDISFIGCEPYINGVATLLATIEKNKLNNIRLYDGDARILLEKLPDHSIDRLFVLFPDPWPKARHYKRRIISQATLELFYRKLKPGGLLRLATDHVDYSAWMLEQCLAFAGFSWVASRPADWKTPPADWVPTRYQAKAEAEGRTPVFLDFVR